MGAAGESESPDSHPDHSVQENARFSGLSIILRTQVQVVEDTGGHLGPPHLIPNNLNSGTIGLAIPVWQGDAPQVTLLLFHPSAGARRLLAESGEQ